MALLNILYLHTDLFSCLSVLFCFVLFLETLIIAVMMCVWGIDFNSLVFIDE